MIKDLIDWRWTQFAAKVHKIGCCFHVIYIANLFLYIQITYLRDKDISIPNVYFLISIGITLIYPVIYETAQLITVGFSGYFRGFWNYVDMVHIFGGYINIGI